MEINRREAGDAVPANIVAAGCAESYR